jgi:hypothetical protein
MRGMRMIPNHFEMVYLYPATCCDVNFTFFWKMADQAIDPSTKPVNADNTLLFK